MQLSMLVEFSIEVLKSHLNLKHILLAGSLHALSCHSLICSKQTILFTKLNEKCLMELVEQGNKYTTYTPTRKKKEPTFQNFFKIINN